MEKEGADSEWTIQLFGALIARRGSQTVGWFRTQATASLLAYLAFYRHQSHPREVLIDLFWPDANLPAGRNRLSVALSALRRQLETPGSPPLFIADHLSVQIAPTLVTTDVASFEEALKTAERQSSARERVRLLTEAAHLYQNPLLPGDYASWITLEQTRLRELFLGAIHRLVQYHLQMRQPEAVLAEALRAIDADPLRDTAHADLMQLYAAAGQLAQALRHYRETVQYYQAELGQPPGAILRNLADSLKQQDNASSPPSEAASTATGEPRAILRLTGAVTLLMFEQERDLSLLENHSASLNQERQRLRREMAARGGQEIYALDGGSLHIFADAVHALEAAVTAQRASADSAKIRAALDTGLLEQDSGEYSGLAVQRVSRLLTASHFGQTICTEATAVILRQRSPPSVFLQNLGSYRLTDSGGSESLFQIQYPGRAVNEFPPLNAKQGYRSSLPSTLTQLIGREREIDDVAAHIASGKRLVTLYGASGIGKTRLAIAVANRLLDNYAGRVWFVPLSGLRNAHDIPSAICEAIRLPAIPGIDLIDQLTEALSGRPALLIFDRFEHLDTEGGKTVSGLLKRVSLLSCLVTSHRVLNLQSEQRIIVEPLALPSYGDNEASLLQNESIRLFADRAHAVRPDFRASSANLATIAELCIRLEGSPLAIELAAARASILSPAQMLKYLSNRFQFLRTHKRDISERHRSLWSAIDASYTLLSSAHQRLFQRLSVFRGGWTLDAAQAVCGDNAGAEEILEASAFLQECSLITTHEVQVGGVPELRFDMLDSLREYGAQKLQEQSELTALRLRHLEWYLQLAESTFPISSASERQVHLDRIGHEYDNFWAALDYLQDSEKSIRLYAALNRIENA